MHDGTMVKTRWNGDENAMVRWRNRDCAIVKSPCYIAFSPSYNSDFTILPLRFHHRVFNIVPSRFHHRTVAFSPSYHRTIALPPSYHRTFIIVPSCFHNCTIAFSPSYHRFSPAYHRVFTIVPSRFHHRAIAISSSCHRLPVVMRNGTFLSTIYAFSLFNPAPFLFPYLWDLSV
jgi:hypothetical protein